MINHFFQPQRQNDYLNTFSEISMCALALGLTYYALAFMAWSCSAAKSLAEFNSEAMRHTP